MSGDPPDFVRRIRDYISDRITQEGGPTYISPEALSNLNDLSNITYPRCDDEESFRLRWLMETTGNDNLPALQYKSKYGEYYGKLRKGYDVAYFLWSDFRRGALHRNIFQYAMNYLTVNADYIWNSDTWHEVYDLMVHRWRLRTARRMERYIPEAIVFDRFKQAYRTEGLPFFIAGRGRRDWRSPDFFQWSQYKFDNVLHRLSDLANIDHLLNAGTILPEGVTVQELMDLRQSLRRLVVRAASSAFNGTD